MLTSIEESVKLQEKSQKSGEKQNGNKPPFGSNSIDNEEAEVPKSTELIKRTKKAPLIDMIEHNGVFFLAMGINRISDNFASEEELEEGINSNWMEIVCNIAMTVAKVIKITEENGK